jgi:hypothetical protein
MNTMIINFLGKLLFPRRQPWHREREAKAILAAAAVALVFAGIIGLVIVWGNHLIR